MIDLALESTIDPTWIHERPDIEFQMKRLANFDTHSSADHELLIENSPTGQTAEKAIRNIDIITNLNNSSLLFLYNLEF